jgi:6-phosphogluconolactonase
MRIFTFILLIFLVAGCRQNKIETKQQQSAYSFYVGTYTDEASRGIYKFILEKDGSLKEKGLAATADNPSYLALSTGKEFLLAVNEIDDNGIGFVESYSIREDSLWRISRQSSGGAHPCFVTVNKMGFVLAANWTGGNVGLLRMDKEGKLSLLLDVQNHRGSSTHKNQQGPHAHSAWFLPEDNYILSIDLGTNELWFSQLDTTRQKLVPGDPYTLKMKPGAGPRHLAIHPNGQWIYVLNELDCTITLVHKSANGNYRRDTSISTLPVDYSGSNTCADIKISSDGNFVYASNRGHNSLAIFRVNPGNGTLDLIGHEPVRGNSPRNVCLSPDDQFILVANRHSNNLVSFKRDKISGNLTYMAQIEAPSPSCIVF